MNPKISLRPLTIQPVTETLLPQVVELDRLGLGGMWSLEGYRREMDSPTSDLLALEKVESLPLAAGQFSLVGIGCLWAILEEAHITLLVIHPHYQAQGLGQALLYALFLSAWKRGMARATLEVRESNRGALRLYHKFGFQQAGRRKQYYQDTREDALILWRGGLQHPQFEQTLMNWQCEATDRLQKFHWAMPSVQVCHPKSEF